MLSYSLLIVFPISLLQKVTELKLFSLISIGSIIYICVTIVVDFPNYMRDHQLQNIELYKFDLYFFSACTFAFFSFTCHMSVASVFSDMKNPNKQRMKKVNFRVCVFQLGIYLVLAVIGYLSLLEDTPLFITQRNAPRKFTQSFNIMIARILVCLILMVTMPLFMILCRQSIHSLLNIMSPVYFNSTRYELYRKFIANLIILMCSLIISNYYPEILVIFNFLGAFCAVFSFLLPTLFQLFIGVSINVIAFTSAFLSIFLKYS